MIAAEIILRSGLAALADPETIRRKAAEVLQRSDYQLDAAGPADILVYKLLLQLIRVLGYLVTWLYRMVEGLPPWLQHVVVWGLILIVVALVGHMIYSVLSLFWSAHKPRGLTSKLSTTTIDPDALESQAEAAAASGDCSLAVRLLFRACLLRLERAESQKIRGGTTNREVLRRHRNSSVYEPIKLFVEILEMKWYGQGVCSRADYEACQQAHASLIRSMKVANRQQSEQNDIRSRDGGRHVHPA